MIYEMIKKILYLWGFISVFVSCSQTDKQCYSFAESWNGKCPITLVKDEVTLTNVRYSKDEFVLSISVGDSAPTSVLSLRKLIEEYTWRMQEVEDYHLNGKEIGGLPFVKSVVSRSTVLTQIIDSIAYLTYTPESTQGCLPLIISISDETDSLAYVYNETWERLTEYECMNAIMPVEMCTWTSNISPLPPLNDVVRVVGIPHISDEGILKIHCLYDADLAYTRSGKPVYIDDIREKYFNSKILGNYLADRMAENENIHRFLNACERRGIGIQFIVEGFKDGIDYDLSTPEFIKQWESWGGCDSIVISSNIFVNAYK